MVTLNLARLPVERDIPFGGGVILKMRRAQGFERAAADQDGADWRGQFMSGAAALKDVGLTDDPTLINRLDMIAGLIILRRALFLFKLLVVDWNLEDGDGVPVPLSDVQAVASWLNRGIEGYGSELGNFLRHAEYGSVAEVTEGNGLRPSPNGSGVSASTTATSADLQKPPVLAESVE